MQQRKRRAAQIFLALLAGLLLTPAAAQAHQYLRLRVLAVVYTHTFTATAGRGTVAKVRSEVDEAVRSLWQASRHRLYLDVEHRTIARRLTRSQLAEPSPGRFWLGPYKQGSRYGVDQDLRDRGIATDRYDLVAVFYAWKNGPGHGSQYGGAALGVNTVLGKAAYLAIPLAWDPERLDAYFEHETLHALESIFESSGYPYFPDVDNGMMFKVLHGDQVPWHAWMLASVPDEVFLGVAGRWGSLQTLAGPLGDEPPGASPTR